MANVSRNPVSAWLQARREGAERDRYYQRLQMLEKGIGKVGQDGIEHGISPRQAAINVFGLTAPSAIAPEEDHSRRLAALRRLQDSADPKDKGFIGEYIDAHERLRGPERH